MHKPLIILPRAILFDMDGTLTEPMLDFAAIRAEMGIGPLGILEAMAQMSPAARQEAQAVLDRHELLAAQGSRLSEGCRELLEWLMHRGIATALITRNSRQSAQTVLRLHELPIGLAICREDAPFKPDPAPLLLACRKIGTDCQATWMVGDGQYDIEAGVAAGMRSVWISQGRTRHFPAEPWATAEHLPGLLEILQTAGAGGGS